MGIGINIGGLKISSSDQSWSSYWTHRSEFYELWKVTGSGTMIGLKRGDSLTITGSGLNAIYAVPDTAPYITRDTDYVFHKSDGSISTACDGNRLIGYDFSKIIVKYLDVAPYTIEYIGILDTGQSVNNKMKDDFHLSIWWDNTLSAYGVLKGNRSSGKSVFIPEPAPPSGLSLAVLSATSIKVDYTDNSGGTATHSIERSTTDESNYAEVHVNATGIITWTDTTCEASTKYYYRIRALNSTGYSSYCASANATTNAAALLYDTFTGADGTALSAHAMDIGPGWTNIDVGLKLKDNRCQATASGGYNTVISDSGKADIDISIDVTVPNAINYYAGVFFRYQDATHYWRCFITKGPNPALELYNVGTPVINESITATAGQTYKLRVVAKGNTIDIYWGAEHFQHTSANYNTATICGIQVYYNPTYLDIPIDNFIVIES